MEASTCLEKIVGNSTVGVVLKDVSLQVHGGELMAVLGSKGKTFFRHFISWNSRIHSNSDHNT